METKMECGEAEMEQDWTESAKVAIVYLERAIATIKEAIKERSLDRIAVARSYLVDIAKALKGYGKIAHQTSKTIQ